jgi:ANTAR domain-containing protein
MTAHGLQVAENQAGQPAVGDGGVTASDHVHAVAERGDRHPQTLQLTASTEPAVVFASLAAQCVPDVCDSCVIDIAEAGAEYRIAYPPAAGVTVANPTGEAHSTPEQVVRLRFSRCVGDSAVDGEGSCGSRCEESCCSRVEGVASFTWRCRMPSAGDRRLVGLLIEHALRTVAWQRSEQLARTATAKAENLDVALQSSRNIGAAIGILMSLHKISQTQAFDLLCVASQRSNRKLRDLALEVVDTGWLDPALVVKTPTS